MAKYVARLGITRQARIEADEFRINLYKLVRRQAGNIKMVKLHLSYAISFESFLSGRSYRITKGLYLVGRALEVQRHPEWKGGGIWPNIKDERSFTDMLARLKVSSAAVIIHVSTLLFRPNLGLSFLKY